MPGIEFVIIFIASVWWGAMDVVLDQSKEDYQSQIQDR